MTYTLIPKWLPSCIRFSNLNLSSLNISSEMIREGEFVILKKDNVMKVVKVRKGR